MTFAHAGRFGADNFVLPSGRPVDAGTLALVCEPGTYTPVTLYADRDRTTGADNPTRIGTSGNLVFYAEPGDYDIVFPGIPPIPVEVHPSPADLADLLTRVTALEGS